MREFATPMMQQYAQIKEEYKDCLLFFRLGDFYELFLDDALLGAEVLGIVLTKRPRGKDGHIPMAGVPFHAADSYIAKLVKAGHKVAICEQVSEPNKKGIVEREVVRIVTPGTILDEKSLTSKEHNYTMSLSITPKVIGIAVCDISTGDFRVTEIPYTGSYEAPLLHEIARFPLAECIVSLAAYNDTKLLHLLSVGRAINTYGYGEWERFADDAPQVLKTHFKTATLEGYGMRGLTEATRAAAALIGYLAHTQKDHVTHIRSIHTYTPKEFVRLDRSTITNLELFSTLREQETRGSLLSVIDHTHTAMGGRLLRTWMRTPLREKKSIEARLDAVEALLHDRPLRSELIDILIPLTDFERTLSRLSVGIGNARDLVALKEALTLAMNARSRLSAARAPLLFSLHSSFPTSIPELITYLAERIVDEPSFDTKEGGMIREGIDAKLDSLRGKAQGGKNWIADYEAQERKRTGINSLKVRYNHIFGYYIEISKANLASAPAEYVRKQTMVNGERFTTLELKEYEETVLTAQSAGFAIEYQLFLDTVVHVLAHTDAIQSVARTIATLDCLISFATIAEKQHYTKPAIASDGRIEIRECRHPVVETILHDTPFVPNDVLLNATDHQLIIITGPNMAGKSVYIRQVAVAVLLMHIGSFVPARSAHIGLVDSIFVRSGASDVITGGLSTFMVEMVETAHILTHATKDSLIVMDEIGRGTSTYDGISIAWAVAEHLVTDPAIAAKTLFATHYHELQALEDKYPERIKNFHAHTEHHDGKPIFLHTILPGPASCSHGIAVAELAGVPKAVTKRAQEMLKELEGKGGKTN